MVVQLAAYSKMDKSEVQPGGEAVMDSQALLLPRRVRADWPNVCQLRAHAFEATQLRLAC